MVITYPNPILRKVIEYDRSLDNAEVIEKMHEAVKEEEAFHTGLELIGLAANQIGIETRILLYKTDEGELFALLNPSIFKYSVDKEPWIETEMCGSLPGYSVPVARSRGILVKSDSFKTMKSFYNWEARIIQHEVDHLNGVLIMDREYGV